MPLPTLASDLSPIPVTAYSLAARWVGTKELPGAADSPFVLGMLRLDQSWPQHDEVPWCSAFLNFIAWQLHLSRSKDLRARSWLSVGRVITLSEAQIGFDVLILNRGGSTNKTFDPSVQKDPAHVTLFAGFDHQGELMGLGGNQSNMVSVAPQPLEAVLGVRRLLRAA